MAEEIPLTEDILDKKRDYIITKTEKIIEEGELIISDDYTVPDNHEFYLFSVSLSAVLSSAVANATLKLYVGSTSNNVATITDGFVAGSTITGVNQSTVFPVPIKVEQGKRVWISNSSFNYPDGKFTGFLVKKEIIN